MMSSSSSKNSGKVYLITGANSGIGKAATEQLARLGETVVMVCRNREKGEKVRSDIRKKLSLDNNSSIDLLIADFSSLESVRALASRFQENYPKLHVLVNNAGLANLRRIVTVDGYETTFQVNYLAPFLLTNLLLEELKASAPSRIVNVSSVSHYGGHMYFNDLGLERNYGVMKAYGQSKLALVLFTRELARRLKGSGVTVYSLHPGAVATNIWNRSAGAFSFLMAIPKLFMRSPEKGAETVVYLATSPGIEDQSGEYFEDKQAKRSSRESYDEQVASNLWDVSMKLCGLSR